MKDSSLPRGFKVDSHENWTIGVSSDDNFGIFKVSNMFLHIICLYCIGVHLSRTISGHLIRFGTFCLFVCLWD